MDSFGAERKDNIFGAKNGALQAVVKYKTAHMQPEPHRRYAFSDDEQDNFSQISGRAY